MAELIGMENLDRVTKVETDGIMDAASGYVLVGEYESLISYIYDTGYKWATFEVDVYF